MIKSYLEAFQEKQTTASNIITLGFFPMLQQKLKFELHTGYPNYPVTRVESEKRHPVPVCAKRETMGPAPKLHQHAESISHRYRIPKSKIFKSEMLALSFEKLCCCSCVCGVDNDMFGNGGGGMEKNCVKSGCCCCKTTAGIGNE
uniref:Uncharacterized protein n=1 Tax=Romanomermis culicivorax TaxID=13658 RepID=A0A915I6L9_ROMCU